MDSNRLGFMSTSTHIGKPQPSGSSLCNPSLWSHLLGGRLSFLQNVCICNYNDIEISIYWNYIYIYIYIYYKSTLSLLEISSCIPKFHPCGRFFHSRNTNVYCCFPVIQHFTCKIVHIAQFCWSSVQARKYTRTRPRFSPSIP